MRGGHLGWGCRSHVAVCTSRRTRTSGGCLEFGGRRARCCPRSDPRSAVAPPPCARASPLTSPARTPPALVLVLISTPPTWPHCHRRDAGCVPTCGNLCCEIHQADECCPTQPRVLQAPTKLAETGYARLWRGLYPLLLRLFKTASPLKNPTYPASCAAPLIHAAQTWSRSWEVVRGQCDADGWQYAAGWPKGGAQWAAAPTLSHVVRRRRWRRARVWTGTLYVFPTMAPCMHVWP